MSTPQSPDFNSSLVFFDQRLSEKEIRSFLRVARGERAVDDLIHRLDDDGGDAWLRKGITARYGEGNPRFVDQLVEGTLDLAALVRVKNASKDAHQGVRSDEERLLSLGAYFFSVASALAWYSTCISSQGRDQVDSVLRDLLRAVKGPWRSLLEKALGSRQSFPRTDMKRINAFLEAGSASRPELQRYTMEVYFKPLQIYFRGSQFRFIGEPEEIVQAFFGDRIETLYDRWLGHREATGEEIRLSVWLMSTFKHFLQEERRRFLKQKSKEQPLMDPERDGDAARRAASIDPWHTYEKAVATEMVRQAIEDTRRYCAERGNEKQWTAFISKYYHGRKYKEIAEELDVREDYARYLAKNGRERYAKTFVRFLLGEGVHPDGAQSAIDEMMALFEEP